MKPFLWERFTTDGHLNDEYRRAGGTLAALRRGAHGEPGASPDMWPYYTRLNAEGHLTRSLSAEHVCLTTYGVHQQGLGFPVHQPDVSLGDALRSLRHSGKFSEDAVDGHVERLATATQPGEVAHHLIALVNLMKATKLPLRFDYTRLFHDLCDLQDELRAGAVRRRWGAAYFRSDSSDTTLPKD
nr:type I-E CRISPR-associated protein Cse2/CasB [Propionibacterium sp.]